MKTIIEILKVIGFLTMVTVGGIITILIILSIVPCLELLLGVH